MPVAIPLAIGLGGAALSAFGGSKKQGSVNTSQNTSFSNEGTQTQTPNENPLFSAFRESLLPYLGQQLKDAQKPVYGDTQKAAALADYNKLFNSSAKNVAAAAAAHGALDSGRYASALTNLGAARATNAADFFSKIPLMNQQYADTRTQNLLNLATNFLGRAPVGTTTTSKNSGTSSSTGTQSETGPSFLGSFLNSLGGFVPATLNQLPTFGAPTTLGQIEH